MSWVETLQAGAFVTEAAESDAGNASILGHRSFGTTHSDVVVGEASHGLTLSGVFPKHRALRADESLSRVLESMDMGMSGDIIAEDLKMVLEELGEITGGQISSQETLNNIFKHFCIGK